MSDYLEQLAANVPDWMLSGLCGQVDPALFFPTQGNNVKTALNICRACPVRTQCLQYALDNNEQHGIWGGTVRDQRRTIWQRNRRDAA